MAYMNYADYYGQFNDESYEICKKFIDGITKTEEGTIIKVRYDAEDERKRLLDWLAHISRIYKLDYIFDRYYHDELGVFKIRFPKINDCFYKIKIDFYSDSFNTWIYRAESEDLIGRTLSSKHWKFVEHQARYVPSKNSNVLFEDYIESVIKDLLKEEINMTFGVAAYRYNGIKKVIFNNPATIVLWNDGTKTVVKRQKGERWDKEKGLAMAIVKHVCGHDKGNYNDIFKKWCEEEE